MQFYIFILIQHQVLEELRASAKSNWYEIHVNVFNFFPKGTQLTRDADKNLKRLAYPWFAVDLPSISKK